MGNYAGEYHRQSRLCNDEETKVPTTCPLTPTDTSRRRLLQTLALAAVQSTACSQREQQHRFSVETLRGVSRVNGSHISVERLGSIQSKVEQNLAEIAVIRELNLDERIEPAVVFRAKL
jgi:hypothetical protein